MAWFAVAIAAVFEVAWAIALKESAGFSRLWPSVAFGICAWLSFAFLSYALKTLPMGTAYAVWTGGGAVGLALIGIIAYGEPAHALRLLCIALIVVGIAGLKLTSGPTVLK